jgi:hypothetical protein
MQQHPSGYRVCSIEISRPWRSRHLYRARINEIDTVDQVRKEITTFDILSDTAQLRGNENGTGAERVSVPT